MKQSVDSDTKPERKQPYWMNCALELFAGEYSRDEEGNLAKAFYERFGSSVDLYYAVANKLVERTIDTPVSSSAAYHMMSEAFNADAAVGTSPETEGRYAHLTEMVLKLNVEIDFASLLAKSY